jgi:DNA-binding transcriptional LysR family regulator
MHKEYPDIKFEVYSCTADDAKEKLEKGLLDFALMFEPADKSKFDYIEIEQYNVMGLLLPEESHLAQKETIQKKDVLDIPLLVSARMQNDSRYPFAKWLKEDYEKLDITATYNLIYNAARMVESGLGYAVCIDHVADSGLKKPLCFRPFYPKVPMHLVLVWKKYQLRSAAQKLFLETFQDLCNAERKRQD